MKNKILVKINNFLIIITVMFAIILLVSDIEKLTIELIIIKIISMLYIGVIWNNNKKIIMKGMIEYERNNRGYDK